MVDVNSLPAENFHGIIAFIADDSDFSLDEAAARLGRAFPRRAVSRSGNEIRIASKLWVLWVVYVDKPHVAGESREMAEWMAGHPLAERIAPCKRRIEFEGTHTDPASRCFADLCRACDVIGGFTGTIIFDLEGQDEF
jgi:hypothetical protein